MLIMLESLIAARTKVLWRHLVLQRIKMRQPDLLLLWADSVLQRKLLTLGVTACTFFPMYPFSTASTAVCDHISPTTNPSFDQLVQLVTVFDSRVIASAASRIKTTANATILIINTASSIWMSSEHVGQANTGYDPKLRRMTFDSRTLLP